MYYFRLNNNALRNLFSQSVQLYATFMHLQGYIITRHKKGEAK